MTSLRSVPRSSPVGDYKSLRQADEQLRRLVLLSRAGLRDRIVVAGPGGLELLGLLCRAGFEQVSCMPSEIPAGESYDVLLAAGYSNAEALCACLQRMAHHLIDGGVLACELTGLDDDRKVADCLEAVSLQVASTVFDLRDKAMVRHSLAHRPPFQRAA